MSHFIRGQRKNSNTSLLIATLITISTMVQHRIRLFIDVGVFYLSSWGDMIYLFKGIEMRHTVCPQIKESIQRPEECRLLNQTQMVLSSNSRSNLLYKTFGKLFLVIEPRFPHLKFKDKFK